MKNFIFGSLFGVVIFVNQASATNNVIDPDGGSHMQTSVNKQSSTMPILKNLYEVTKSMFYVTEDCIKLVTAACDDSKDGDARKTLDTEYQALLSTIDNTAGSVWGEIDSLSVKFKNTKSNIEAFPLNTELLGIKGTNIASVVNAQSASQSLMVARHKIIEVLAQYSSM